MQDDIRELKADVKELVKQGAVHNQLLLTHEARSLALQEGQKSLESEMEPIKDHVKFVEKVFKVLGGIALAVTTSAAIKWALTLLF